MLMNTTAHSRSLDLESGVWSGRFLGASRLPRATVHLDALMLVAQPVDPRCPNEWHIFSSASFLFDLHPKAGKILEKANRLNQRGLPP